MVSPAAQFMRVGTASLAHSGATTTTTLARASASRSTSSATRALSLRGGYGIYYPSQMWRENYGNTAGFAQTTTTYSASDANQAAFILSSGFPFPVVQPQGVALGPQPFLGQTVSIDERDGQTPMSQQMSLNVQQQFGGSWLIDVGYSAETLAETSPQAATTSTSSIRSIFRSA